MKARIAELTFEMKDVHAQKTIDFIKFCGFVCRGWLCAKSEEDSNQFSNLAAVLTRFSKFQIRRIENEKL
jgi:hypothetical protein